MLTDVNGTSGAAYVVGAPHETLTVGESQGSIEAHLGDSGVQRLQDGTFGGPSDTNQFDHWGSAIVISKLDADPCAEIIVGAPASGHAGHVTIVHGSLTGIAVSPYELLTAPDPTADDSYGAALAVARDRTIGRSILWVGAPGTSVNDVANAGALYRYLVSPAGVLTLAGTFTEATAGIGLTPAQGDRFGQVLSATPDGGVTIGMPNRAVADQRAAGAVIHLSGGYDATPPASAQVVTQDSPGVPDRAETGDHFGAAVAAGGRYVGVPGEDLGSMSDAGLVQSFSIVAASRLVAGRAWTASSKGVPSSAHAGDRFGSSLSTGFGVGCYNSPSVVVGAPGMDQGTAKDSGGVVVLPYLQLKYACRGALLQQGHGLPGSPESGDHLGATVSAVVRGSGHGDEETDDVAIGVPGEDIDGQRDAGRAILLNGSGAEGWSPFSQGAVEIDSVTGPHELMHLGDTLSTGPA